MQCSHTSWSSPRGDHRNIYAVVPLEALFNAAWCVWIPQPRGTQLQLRCSVVGLLRALLAPRLSCSRVSSRLGPLCVSCPLPDSVWPFGCHKAVYWRRFGGLASPWGGAGIIVPFSGGFAGLITTAVDDFRSRPAASIILVAPTGCHRGLVTCLSPSPRSHTGSWTPCPALVNPMSPIRTA